MRRALPSLLLAGFALATAGCGSYDKDDVQAASTVPTTTTTPQSVAAPPAADTTATGPVPLTPEEFASLGEQVCAAAASSLANFHVAVQITGADPLRIAQLLDSAADQSERAAAALGSLSPPPGDEAFAQRLEAQRARLTATLRALADSYAAGDVAGVQTHSAELDQEGTAMQRLAAEYGLTKCHFRGLGDSAP